MTKLPEKKLRILLSLTYYRPHVSGLTIYVQRLAEALAARGHTVTVLTSQYDKRLPQEEIINGVRVVREPVAFWISKGAIMPGYFRTAAQLLRSLRTRMITPISAVYCAVFRTNEKSFRHL